MFCPMEGEGKGIQGGRREAGGYGLANINVQTNCDVTRLIPTIVGVNIKTVVVFIYTHRVLTFPFRVVRSPGALAWP